MESMFHRYRNVTVLLGVLFAQLILLAWQVRSDSDVPLVRVWAVTAVTPVASAIETARNGTTGFFDSYFTLRNAREESQKLKTEVDRLRLENQFLKNELASAQRAESMVGFQARTPSKMIGARVIGATPGVGSKSILIDRGVAAGVHRGMAVVTPDGIVGRVVEVFPFASQVLAITDPSFAAGVESQKNHVHGVLRGLGNGAARVDNVPAGEKVEKGEIFFTSGEDRIFPKGLPAGKVTSVKEGQNSQEIIIDPSGAEGAPEEVLVIVDPVHQAIPEAPAAETSVFLAPDVQTDDSQHGSPAAGTAADKLLDQYRKIGAAQNHTFGEGQPGSLPPNFNIKVPGVNAPADGTPATTPKTAAVPPAGTAPPNATNPAAPKPATGVPGATANAAAAPKPATGAPTPVNNSPTTVARPASGSPAGAPAASAPAPSAPKPAAPRPATAAPAAASAPPAKPARPPQPDPGYPPDN